MRLLKRSNSKRGNAIIEFALTASAMIPLLTGVTQFGHSFYMYNQLVSTVKGSARYASVASYTSTTSTPASDYTTAVKNMAVYGKTNPVTGNADLSLNDAPLVRGLATSNIAIDVTMNGSVPKDIKVKVVNFTIDSVFRSFTFNGKPHATYRYNGS